MGGVCCPCIIQALGRGGGMGDFIVLRLQLAFFFLEMESASSWPWIFYFFLKKRLIELVALPWQRLPQ